MYRAAIVNNDCDLIKNLYMQIENTLKKKKILYEIDIIDSYSKLLEKITVNKYNIIFIEIDMNCENGIDIAKRIRDENEDIDIVLISNTEKNWRLGFEVGALSYMVKPCDPDEIKRTILCSLSIYDYAHQILTVKDNEGRKYNVKYSVITYIEIINKDITIHIANDKPFCCRGNLSKIETNLDGRFMRCHNSFIVNMDYIKNFKRYEFELKSTDKVRISKANYRKFTDYYQNYLENK